MKSRRVVFTLLLTAAFTAGANAASPPGMQPSAEDLGIVPLPRTIATSDGTFETPAQWSVYGKNPEELTAAASAMTYLRERGATVYLVKNSGATVQFTIVKDAALGKEGYRLGVQGSGVEISAATGAGLFYGLQTFEQIIEARGSQLPYLQIEDTPRFAWRGIHLDVARHFFPVPVVERYIDVAAHYKLNVFHWHLTDDQGWRLEIKRYPLLTKVGSCRAQTEIDNDATEFDGKPYCGYYTQDQVREVVEYARKRFVTIVPEIDMPGHADASVAGYPWLACGSPKVKVRETWGVSHELYCPSEPTFAFLTNVLVEVTKLFPGPYVHAGGDETPKDEWQHSAVVHALMQRQHLKTYDEVQGYFERRIEAILKRFGRRMVGWDEILDDGVSTTATVMAWHSSARGIKAAQHGNDVVLSPDGPLYFDAYQGDSNDEPEAIGGLSRLQDVYAFEPLPRTVPAAVAKHVIGVQANLWTEYIADPSYLFYMLLPRELALSEVAWTTPERRDWDSFESRSGMQYAWLTRHHVNFRIPNPTLSVNGGDLRFSNVNPSMRTVALQTGNQSVIVTATSNVPGAEIRCTMDGTKPGATSHLYGAPLRLAPGERASIDVTCATVLRDGRISTPTEVVIRR